MAKSLFIISLIILFLPLGCYKAGQTVDDRILPYGDSGLTLVQAAQRLRADGLPVVVEQRELKDFARFSATGGMELSLDCSGHKVHLRLYRLGNQKNYQKAIDYILDTEAQQRLSHPGFRYAFIFSKDLLLTYDEIPDHCRADLITGFKEL